MHDVKVRFFVPRGSISLCTIDLTMMAATRMVAGQGEAYCASPSFEAPGKGSRRPVVPPHSRGGRTLIRHFADPHNSSLRDGWS